MKVFSQVANPERNIDRSGKQFHVTAFGRNLRPPAYPANMNQSSPYYPQTDREIEHFIRTPKSMLQKFANDAAWQRLRQTNAVHISCMYTGKFHRQQWASYHSNCSKAAQKSGGIKPSTSMMGLSIHTGEEKG